MIMLYYEVEHNYSPFMKSFGHFFGIMSIYKSVYLSKAVKQNKQKQQFMWNLYGIAPLQITYQ